MNNEQQEIIDEAYENFVNWALSEENQNNKNEIVKIPSSKEIFIKRIKGDNEIIKKMGKIYCDKFFERWGLKIEERELSLEERIEITDNISKNIREDLYSFAFNNPLYVGDSGRSDDEQRHLILDEFDVPSKLITVTYDDKTIESYE
jgi:hypothetical protein